MHNQTARLVVSYHTDHEDRIAALLRYSPTTIVMSCIKSSTPSATHVRLAATVCSRCVRNLTQRSRSKARQQTPNTTAAPSTTGIAAPSVSGEARSERPQLAASGKMTTSHSMFGA